MSTVNVEVEEDENEKWHNDFDGCFDEVRPENRVQLSRVRVRYLLLSPRTTGDRSLTTS